jgi:hypothetical protein
MNSTDQLELNKRVVMQYVDAFNRGDPEALLKLFSRDGARNLCKAVPGARANREVV